MFEEEQDSTLDPVALASAPETASTAPAPKRRSRSNRAATPEIDLSQVRVDFEDAKNLRERLIRIAESLPGTYLNVTQICRLLIRQNQTQQTLHNARVSIGREFESNPDLFERVEQDRATYRYLGAGRQQETPELAPAMTISPNGRHVSDEH